MASGHGGLRRENGDELAADILQQHRIGVVVLAHLVELHAPPGHDGLFARHVGRSQRLADLVALGRLGAVDGVGHHDQAHELARGEVVQVLARFLLEHRVDLADHRPLGGEVERERAARDHPFELVADRVIERLLGEARVLRHDRIGLVAELGHRLYQQDAVGRIARGHQDIGVRGLELLHLGGQ